MSEPALCRRVFVERLLDEVWIAEAVHQASADKMAALCCLERRHILVFDGEADHFKTAFALAIWPSRKQVCACVMRAIEISVTVHLSRLSVRPSCQGDWPREGEHLPSAQDRAVPYRSRFGTKTLSGSGLMTAVTCDGFLHGS